jgi:Ankyrin repeats (many copies)/Ankyrin repeat
MNDRFSIFVRAVIDGDVPAATRMLKANPEFAVTAFDTGATRGGPANFFYEDIAHYCYRGDTALHMAAAAFQREAARLLVRHGAALDAKNRRAAEPLHYAADANRWDPTAQSATIRYLLSAGAPADSTDANRATPLHRAVRTRSAAAVRALLAGGATVHVRNRNGSTPLDLAGRTTGRGGSGSTRAREQQAIIVALLLEAGAR